MTGVRLRDGEPRAPLAAGDVAFFEFGSLEPEMTGDAADVVFGQKNVAAPGAAVGAARLAFEAEIEPADFNRLGCRCACRA